MTQQFEQVKLAQEEAKRRMVDNGRALLALNQKHAGQTIYIVGAGPQLNDLTPRQIKGLSESVSIGVNRVPYKITTGYFLSAYLSENVLARMAHPGCQPIHMRKIYAPPMVNGVLTCQRTIFSPQIGFPAAFSPDHYVLTTRQNVILGATNLAVILGAREIVYVGVEQSNMLHFYNSDDVLKQRMVRDILAVPEICFNVDHSHVADSRQGKLDRLKSRIDDLKARRWAIDITSGFRQYFAILDAIGIRYFATKKESVIFQAGAPLRPLDDLLSGGPVEPGNAGDRE